MDLNGDLGRRYGSLGLTLDGLMTRLRAEPAEDFEAGGPDAERAVEYAQRLHDRLALPGAVRIEVETAIPQHVGLGSGTQLALATGAAIDRLYGLELGARTAAQLLERGLRSGIGTGAFEQGGFLVDGGVGDEEEDRLPPIIGRLEFPSAWRVLLIFDTRGHGLHGRQETEAFDALPDFQTAQAARLCRLVLMRVLPALVQRNCHAFGEGIGELQRAVGDYFAPAQGGRFTSESVVEALAWLQGQGVPGVGQSSWGPTGFAIVDSETRAHALLRAAQPIFGQTPLRFQVLRARNCGGKIEADEAAASRATARNL